MNNSLLSKLTLVIPTYNRQPYALRNMRYWSGREVTVHVMDGSKFPIPKSKLNEISGNVHYHHANCSMEERMQLGAKLVESEYAAMCGDDEFLPPSGLLACLKFLEVNNDYTSCIGRCVGFRVHDRKITLFPVKEYHQTHFVNQNSISERIYYHIGNFMVTTFYGVHRKDSFKFCFGISLNESWSSPYIAETIIELFSAAFGKSKVLPNASWLRSFENEPTQTIAFNRKYSISQWYDDPSKVEEVEKAFSIIKYALYSLCTIDECNAVWRAACSALKMRINGDRASANSSNIKPPLLSFYNSIINILNAYPKLKFFIKSIFIKLKPHPEYDYFTTSSDYSYNNLKSRSRIVIDDVDLGEIWDAVLLFHSMKERGGGG